MEKILLLVGESGCGKSTLMKNLLKTWPLKYHLVLSTTTRPMREGEFNDIDYHFKALEDYNQLKQTDTPIQETHFGGNYYATFPKDYLRPDREVAVLAVVPKHIEVIKSAFPDKKVLHVFFKTSDALLRRHLSDLPEDLIQQRIDRGNIREQYLKEYNLESTDGLTVYDNDVDESLHYKVDDFTREN